MGERARESESESERERERKLEFVWVSFGVFLKKKVVVCAVNVVRTSMSGSGTGVKLSFSNLTHGCRKNSFAVGLAHDLRDINVIKKCCPAVDTVRVIVTGSSNVCVFTRLNVSS